MVGFSLLKAPSRSGRDAATDHCLSPREALGDVFAGPLRRGIRPAIHQSGLDRSAPSSSPSSPEADLSEIPACCWLLASPASQITFSSHDGGLSGGYVLPLNRLPRSLLYKNFAGQDLSHALQPLERLFWDTYLLRVFTASAAVHVELEAQIDKTISQAGSIVQVQSQHNQHA